MIDEKNPKDHLSSSAHAWDKFEHAVDVAVKSGPKHKPVLSPKVKDRPAIKARVRRGKMGD